MHDPRPSATLGDYVALARPSHWTKHVFIVPGIALAAMLPGDGSWLGPHLLFGFASACLIASANYVLNEWLDAADDVHHPRKSTRPAVAKRLRPAIVWGEYAGLSILGVVAALAVSGVFALVAALFLASGWLYNVPPVRTKARAGLDVLTESVNNPLRLILGWVMVDPTTLPPGSLLLAYWMGGGFLMATKRLAEYRSVMRESGLEALHRYRRSFRGYTEHSLLLSAFLYSQLAAFFLAVFLVKYRIEYLLSLPLFALLFAAYLRLGLQPDSAAQAPEGLFRERAVMLPLALLVAALIVLTFVDLPGLDRLSDPHYLSVPWSLEN